MNADNLVSELTAEIDALKPFANLTAACDALNGSNGNRGLRAKYLDRLYGLRHSQNLSDPLVVGIGAEINRLCAREIALLSPIQDRDHANGQGWTSWPVDSLTPEEREAL